MLAPAAKIGQKFTYASMPVEISSFPAHGTQRFDVRVNGLLAGSIVALLSEDSDLKNGPWNVTGFRLDYPSKAVFVTVRPPHHCHCGACPCRSHYPPRVSIIVSSSC